MSHNNGLVGRGRLRITDNPQFPETDFFEPGKSFDCRLRHATGGFWDDAIYDIRCASIKFADTDFASPFDVECNTGNYTFFWNGRSFLEFAFSRHEHNTIDYTSFYQKYWQGRVSGAASLVRAPESFTKLHFFSGTAFGWKAKDGKLRYVRFRIIPGDRSAQVPVIDQKWVEEVTNDPNSAPILADQRRSPDDTRSNNYLKNEWAERVKAGPVHYILQLQLHEVTPEDSPEILNPIKPWDEETHPFLDLAFVEIHETLSPEESAFMAFDITNLPSSMSILPAKSLDDYTALNYMRAQSKWSIAARRALIRLIGPTKRIPDDAPHNLDLPGI